ncbi:MAG: rhodanese-related sulfurtransferase [Mesorhizobium sp.]|nr:rhodanese-related sulfurtransferase [Mesorhizobium sp.]MCO5162541.1 rhodanese-related sulfurtransferase [Mesorhizobium sp.]
MDRSTSDKPFCVAALYRFVHIADPAALRDDLAPFCCGQGIKGTLLIAAEGINGTVAGSEAAIEALVERLATHGLTDLEIKFSRASSMPFHRLKVRLKAEIVTMGRPGIDPLSSVGTYVDPSEWNALIADPDTVVIDTRNDYEVAIGTFRGAVDPGTKSFREFPGWAEANRDMLEGRKVAMFCTGGIRCEKATAFVRSLGLEDVYHLKGGILKYLEEVPASESLWEGECFVFDERVSVGHGLEEGEAELCRACRMPLTAADRASSLYQPGISCAQCHDERSQGDRARYAERQRQVELAERRGEEHIGRRI